MVLLSSMTRTLTGPGDDALTAASSLEVAAESVCIFVISF
jgi:hypothetical protein